MKRGGSDDFLVVFSMNIEITSVSSTFIMLPNLPQFLSFLINLPSSLKVNLLDNRT